MNGYQYGEQAGYDGNGMPQDGQQDMLGQQNMMMMGQGMLDGEADSGAAGGQSLDDIVNLNNMSTNLNSKLLRRQSVPHGFHNATQNQGNNYNPNMRRMNSMMEFNGSRSPAEPMSTYSYPTGLNSNQGSTMSGNNTPGKNPQLPLQNRRQSGNTELNLSTTFANTPQNYAAMMNPSASYASPAHQTGMDLDITSPFLDPSLGLPLDYSLDQNDMGNNMGSMGGSMDGNMAGSLGQNIGGNIGGSMGANMSQDMSNGVGHNMGNHASNGMNNGMSNNMGSNVNGNLGNSLNNNMSGSMGRSMNANMGQNMSQNIGQNLSNNMAGNINNMGTNGSMSGNMSSGMDNMGSSTDEIQMSMYNQAQFNQNMTTSPMHPGTPQGRPIGPPRVASQPSTTGSTPNGQSQRPSMQHQLSRTQSSASYTPGPQHGGNISSGDAQQSQRPPNSRQTTTNTGFQGQIQNPQPGSIQDRGMGRSSDNYDGINGPLPLQPKQYNPNNQNFPWVPEGGAWPSTMNNKPHMQSAYKNAYSSTGFDMLGVLVRCKPLVRAIVELISYADARCNPTKSRDQYRFGRLVMRVRGL